MNRVFFNLALILSIFTCNIPLSAQPIADFSIDASVCLQQQVLVQNLSTSATSFEWDFCADDLMSLKSLDTAAILATLQGGYGFKMVEDNGLWYGFAVSQSNNSLIRLDFGSDPTSTPSVTFLGNPGGALQLPQGMDIIKVDSNWIGFVSFSNIDFGFVRLEFGNSPANFPVATNVGTFGLTGRMWDVKLISNSNDCFLVTVNRDNNSLTRVYFGNSFLNSVPPGNVFESVSIPGANLLLGLDLILVGTNWKAFVASYSSNSVLQLNLGSTLASSTLNVEGNYVFPNFSNPFRVRIIQEGSAYRGFVANNSSPVTIVDFKDTNPTQTPEVISQPSLPVMIGHDAFRWEGKTILFGVSFFDTKVNRAVFEQECGASILFDTDQTLKNIVFAQPGDKMVELRATDAFGILSIKAHSLAVSSMVSPDIAFSVMDGCTQHPISFFSNNTSADITDYNWDFGDTNTSMLENPTHQYTSAGEYEVLLNVTASNGCNNIARQNITIYNEPVPDFNLPAAAPICTNQEYFFTNNSAFDAGSNPIWQWEVNGNPVSTDLDLSYSISTSIQQDVKLIASIPGCSNEIMKSILTVEEGPLADFTFDNGCVETSILFTNTTAGPVTGYSWDFGDTNVSSQTNGQNTYTGFGVYDVTLTASNAVGCNNSTTKPITIYSKPQPDFSIDLPPFSCSGSPSQFNDLTPNPTDSNLSGWTWSFGDPSNGTSTTRNPLYTYSNAGSYDVQLDVITNFGCSNAVQKTINIAQSPPSGFSFNPACVNQGTVFTPNAINGINSWQWAIGTATYSSPSPTHVFSFPSTYNAQLTVTGANGCVAISSQPITVPAVPSLDFSASNLCEDQPVEFMDATLIGLDVPVSWAWEFGTVGTASGKNPSFTFDDPGSYPTRMTVTNQSGCKYSISKNISVVTSPTATFTATPQIGTAPLVVQLTNTTTNSNSQLWTINGTGETSTDDSPTFTFNNLGDYVIDLTVTNDQGCESTTSKTVSVVIPTLDLELTSLTVVPAATGEQRLLVSVKNNSNSTIVGPKLAVDIAGQAIINELLNVTLLPGATHTQMLATQVVGARGDLDYICVEIVLDGDFNKSNNKKCVGARSISVLDPYPNPSAETINLEWISQKSGNAEVYIFSSTGNKVFENAFSDFQPGLNRVAVAVDKLNPGIYYLLFVTGDSRRSFPVIIRR